jgi:transposase
LFAPENIALIQLLPYSPELNPAEQIWRLLRSRYFAIKVFDSLDNAIDQAKLGLSEISAEKGAVSRLTNWPWISDILNAY